MNSCAWENRIFQGRRSSLRHLVEQNVRGSVIEVGNDNVGPSVVVQIGNRRRNRTGSGRIGGGGLKGAVAVAEQDICLRVAVVGNHQIQLAVPVEIAHRQAAVIGSAEDGPLRLEGSVPIPEHEIEVGIVAFAALVEDDCQVKGADATEVREDQIPRLVLRNIGPAGVERTVCVPKKDTDVIRRRSDHQIEDAVAVDVTDRER